jgi:hypothetical protein
MTKPTTTPQTTKPTTKPTTVLPGWIKNNAKWWSTNQVSDKEFLDTIEFLAKEKIIVIKKTQSLEQSKSVPAWIKKSASWWADGLISDEDFTRGIEYLVNVGAIRI